MAKEDCLRILKEAIKIGVEDVTFSGGEPLLWPYLADAIEIAKSGRMRISVYTSGNVANFKEIISLLKDLGLERCIFSIFGSTKANHENITRVAGSFISTLDAVSWSQKVGLMTEFHFVPLVGNFNDIEATSNLADNLGIDCLSVLRFVPQGRGKTLKAHILNRAQNLELRETIISLRNAGRNIRTGSPYNFLLLNNQPECCSGIDRITIGPDLKIYPCDAFKQIMAEDLVGSLLFSTLGDSSLNECWNNSPFLKVIRNYLTTEFAEPCVSCNLLEKCLSGCLAQKVIYYRELKKRADPLCLINH